MGRKTNGEKRPPEQRAAEQLLQALSAASTEEATAKARALVGALQMDPLVLTLSIQRATGRFALVSNVDPARLADDLKLLHDAVLELTKRLSEEMVAAAKGPAPRA